MWAHVLTRSIVVPRPRDEVFAFFADAGNLERITPPELGFHITTPGKIEMAAGTLIDHDLRLRGFPVKWRTEISVWDPPFEFVDRQLKGPYSEWIHRHRFTEPGPGSTLIEDEVKYRLPFWPLGELGRFLITRELDHIFDYRQRVVAEILG
jgi:ligand-binding SRPBCC domain-containing protein